MYGSAIAVDVSARTPTLPRVTLDPVHPLPGALHEWVADHLDTGVLGNWEPAAGTSAFVPAAGRNLTVYNSGGSRAVRADGVDDYATAIDLVADQPVTVYMVARLISLDPDVANTLVGRGNGNAFNIMTNTARTFWQFLGGATLVSTAPVDLNWHVFALSYNGAASAFQVDGSEVVGNAGTLGITQLRLGFGGSQYSNAEYKRLSIVQGATTKAQRDATIAGLREHYRF